VSALLLQINCHYLPAEIQGWKGLLLLSCLPKSIVLVRIYTIFVLYMLYFQYCCISICIEVPEGYHNAFGQSS